MSWALELNNSEYWPVLSTQRTEKIIAEKGNGVCRSHQKTVRIRRVLALGEYQHQKTIFSSGSLAMFQKGAIHTVWSQCFLGLKGTTQKSAWSNFLLLPLRPLSSGEGRLSANTLHSPVFLASPKELRLAHTSQEKQKHQKNIHLSGLSQEPYFRPAFQLG